MKVEHIKLSLVAQDDAVSEGAAIRCFEANISIPRVEWEIVQWSDIVHVLARQLITAARSAEEAE
jgi:hypothetical protein